MRKVLLLALTCSSAITASGCAGASRDTARLLGFMQSKSSTSLTTEIAKQAHGQAMLMKFARESEQTIQPQLDLQAIKDGTTVTISDSNYECEATSVDDVSAAISCTLKADDQFTCGSDQYTVKSGATMKLGFSLPSENLFDFYLEEKATVTGGKFTTDGKAIDCKIKMEWDIAKLVEAAQAGKDVDPYDFKCSGDMQCKVGDTVITCDSLKSAMNDVAKDSKNACTDI